MDLRPPSEIAALKADSFGRISLMQGGDGPFVRRDLAHVPLWLRLPAWWLARREARALQRVLVDVASVAPSRRVELRRATLEDVFVSLVNTGDSEDDLRRALRADDTAAEEKFVAAGFADKRLPVMYNDFVLVGPKADPVGTKGNDIVAALKKVAAANAPFIARGDKSGTNAAELRFWAMAGLTGQKGAGYKECGCGMGPALNMAASSGAYVLAEPAEVGVKRKAQAVIIATGSEVQLALAAQKLLAERKIAVRVVSMPSNTTFDRQDVKYKKSVLPADMPRIAVEMGVTDGWWKYGCAAVVGIDTFGESAPAGVLFKHFGFTAENIAETVQAALQRAR